MHGRSRITIDPHTPIMPERSTLGFHQPRRHCLHQARSVVRCSARRMKGELASFQKTAHKTDFCTLYLLSCLWMTAPNELYFVFWCGHSRDSNGYYYETASWVPYHIHTTWCNHSPCAELGFSTQHNKI